MSILDVFRRKPTLRELCRREHGDEFASDYDMLAAGGVIGGYAETITFINKVGSGQGKAQRRMEKGMSMLSAQCDELRAMAESAGLAMPQAATLMMEAADTIIELRGALQVASVDYRYLEAENAKLQELCKEWHRFSYELFDECFGEPEANDDFMALDDRMRELGVEVDDA